MEQQQQQPLQQNYQQQQQEQQTPTTISSSTPSETLRPGASLTASKDYLAGDGASPMAPEVMEVNRAVKEKGGTAQILLVSRFQTMYIQECNLWWQ